MQNSLKKYNLSTCFKINLLSSLIFLIVIGFSNYLTEMHFTQSKQFIESNELDTAIGSFMLLVILDILVGLFWVIFSITIILLMPLFERFQDNIKSIFGLISCNIAISGYLYTNFTHQLAIYYAVFVFSGIFITLFSRHNKAIRKMGLK